MDNCPYASARGYFCSLSNLIFFLLDFTPFLEENFLQVQGENTWALPSKQTHPKGLKPQVDKMYQPLVMF